MGKRQFRSKTGRTVQVEDRPRLQNMPPRTKLGDEIREAMAKDRTPLMPDVDFADLERRVFEYAGQALIHRKGNHDS